MSKLQAPFVDQSIRRQRSLSTPITFSAVMGLTDTPIYTGVTGKFFLIRAISVCNHTVGHGSSGAVALSLYYQGDHWLDAFSVAANTTVPIDGLTGMMLADGENLSGFSDDIKTTVFGWGLQIEGGDSWRL